MEFVREGGDQAVATLGMQYIVVIESEHPRQFAMPISDQELQDHLDELRYNPAVDDGVREAALAWISGKATEILGPPAVGNGGAVQLDLVTAARELWTIPFEAATTPDGEPLFARKDPVVVLTRRVPQHFAEQRPAWPARPRVLFAHASPAWLGADPVPAAEHRAALLKALRPWVDPLPGLDVVVGDERSVLTTLPEASLQDIAEACRAAEKEGRPYTHVHILAHGVFVQHPVYSSRSGYAIALAADDGKAAEADAIVTALRPHAEDGSRADLPLVVSLAVCDGGNAANSRVRAAGVAQELHRDGIPVVVASQLPLTFEGSVVLARELYGGWMAGRDVRAVLHAARVALREETDSRHDWVSMVAYVRLPEGYADYLLQVRLAGQLAALETAKRHDQEMERLTPELRPYDAVTERLKECAERLEGFLTQPSTPGQPTRVEVMQENAGLLGSANKRLAELLYRRAQVDPARSAEWLQASREAMVRARDAYREGFARNPSHHWTGVQYLAIDAALKGVVSNVGQWYACLVAAMTERDRDDTKAADRVWALGSLVELALLAGVAPGATAAEVDGPAVLDDLRTSVEALPAGTFGVVSPIDSTCRQLERYVSWWTAANGFFPGASTDLSEAAKALAERLRSPAGVVSSVGHAAVDDRAGGAEPADTM
jgi:hypothetical protein